MNIDSLKTKRAGFAAAIPQLHAQIEQCKSHIAANQGAIETLDAIVAEMEAEAEAQDVPHTETVEPVTPAARKPRKPGAPKPAPVAVPPQA